MEMTTVLRALNERLGVIEQKGVLHDQMIASILNTAGLGPATRELLIAQRDRTTRAGSSPGAYNHLLRLLGHNTGDNDEDDDPEF